MIYPTDEIKSSNIPFKHIMTEKQHMQLFTPPMKSCKNGIKTRQHIFRA